MKRLLSILLSVTVLTSTVVCLSNVTTNAAIVTSNPVAERWVDDGMGLKYLYDDGSYGSGWEFINNEWYFFDRETNYMYVGFLWDENWQAWYYFNPLNGIMQRGWLSIDGERYYADDSGALLIGWKWVEDAWYYFHEDGRMAHSEWAKDGDIWYYLREDGTWNAEPQWTDGQTFDNAVNLGEDFYAIINVPATGTRVGVDLDSTDYANVEIQTPRAMRDKTILAQLWHFERQTDGSYRITNLANNMCLDVYNMGIDYGTNVQVAESADTIGQRWYAYQNGSYYGLISQCNTWNNTVLDIADGKSEEGTNIQIYAHNGTGAQQFDFEFIDLCDYVLLKGDVNRDGIVNVRDATLLQEYLVYNVSLNSDMQYICDTDNNGKVNINDVTKIQAYCVGMISDFGNNEFVVPSIPDAPSLDPDDTEIL